VLLCFLPFNFLILGEKEPTTAASWYNYYMADAVLGVGDIAVNKKFLWL
jgi:hypothetical protein